MRIFKSIILIAFISLSVKLNAMPPHPDMIDKYRNDGQLKLLMNRLNSINTRMNMNSPLKAFSPNGVRKVPVLLVSYSTPYGASSNLFLSIRNVKMQSIPVYVIFLIFMVTLSVMLKRYGGKNSAVLKPFATVYLFLFIFLVSCGISKEDDDDEEDSFTDKAVYSRLLNGDTASDLSVRKYYQDMSNNNLNLVFDFYGPVKVSKSWDYYGKNSAGNDMHPGELVSEALRLMVSKYTSVDFSMYDNDNNGEIDAVIIIHEGPGEEASGGADTIWSHQWDLTSAAVSGDGNGPVNAGNGDLFNIYTIQPEYTSTKGDSSIGVFVHEFGHVLGLPDLYDTSVSPNTHGVGDWSLMASGSWKGPVTNDGTTPAPLLAWERLKAGGTGANKWITITTLGAVTGQPIGNIETTKTVFKIVLDATAGQEQYLLIEGKQSSTSTQWYVPGPAPAGGILISHIHEGVIGQYTVTDEVNAGDSRVHGVNIVESAGGNDLWSMPGNSGNLSDLYTAGGITNAIIYTDNTNYTIVTSSTTIDINTSMITPSPLSMTFDVAL